MTATNTESLAPIAAAERIEAMDVLRGFALLGILLMNLEGFVGPVMASGTGLDPRLTGIDRTVDLLVYVLVQGKFYTLFSLLFGMGFAVMSQRAEQANRPFAGVYWRRGLLLLAFGVTHALFIWAGDVLMMYALCSFLLLAFRPLPTRWFVWLGLAAYVMPIGFMLLMGAMGSLLAGTEGWDKAMAQIGVQMQTLIESERTAYGSGSYAEATWQRLKSTGMALSNITMFGFIVFGMFLIGAWFVRSGAIARPREFPRLYAALRWAALPLGLLAMLGSVALAPTMDFATFNLRVSSAFTLQMIANLLMCLGYVAWVMRALGSPAWQRPLGWLAPAGRMALTNYLMQSLVCTWIFYGYGLGYFEQLPRAWQPLFALALFGLQVLLSRWWLSRFRFGPMEWLWRSLTYLKPQPLRLRAG
ncbi:DUF418 domain-containing protein [Pseudoxanthomonas sp. LH2527]|uniref:DUF418 domain-containing protein n=1 Tax=Pseudoxanthomonas sp. LH2527 TaxID=2923249 RepID=UPI001F13EFA0|nr:DUF418 domain-containing protein [Pseudoxanthomonas sp. LH2527]MCH6484105.1 DUF418 domain-containing protein [Pseudoxanthomonas sp. LH2527]